MRRGVVRWTYLLALLAFVAWLGNSFASGYIYAWGEGMVVGDPAAASTEFVSTVRDLTVVEGQKVNKGEIIGKTTSQVVAAQRASLTSEAAQRAIKVAELKVKRSVIAATLSVAENRETVAVDGQRQLTSLSNKGLIPAITNTAAAEAAYRGRVDAETLRAEGAAMDAQINTLQKAIDEANDALTSLSRLHDDGNVRAPIDGYVSKRLVSPGSVTEPGKPMIEFVGTNPYVLAYFQVGRFFSLHPGRKVTISTGNSHTFSGTVTRVDVIAGALPREFQGQLVPTERKQLVRIDFDPGQEVPPFFTKVAVR